VVQKDAYGNVIAKLSREGESIILCAHMDTVAVGKDVIKVVVDEDNGMTVRPFLAPTTKMRSPLYSKCWR
jgi:acetylornithine deacetylase/succinyl-diaminopimelate desuccinylase-like protein